MSIELTGSSPLEDMLINAYVDEMEVHPRAAKRADHYLCFPILQIEAAMSTSLEDVLNDACARDGG